MTLQELQPTEDERIIGARLRDLEHPDVHIRTRARAALARYGRAAIEPLVKLLNSGSALGRWEAAHTLGAIGDAAAIPSLIDALDDPEQPVRWLAAQGLIAIGPGCVPSLLQTLVAHADDSWILAGAHHVLRALCNEVTQPVVAALEGPVASLEAPLAAYHALERLKGR